MLFPLLLYSHELKLKRKDSLDSRIHVYFHFIWFETFTGFSWTARIHAQKPQIKVVQWTVSSYPSQRRLKLYSCASVTAISLEHREKHFKTSHLYPIKWHVHLPWIPQKLWQHHFCWQQWIFKEDTRLRVQDTGISLSVGFCFQMKSPTLGIVSWALSLIAASSRIFIGS